MAKRRRTGVNYLLRFTLKEEVVYKSGITTRRLEARISEIVSGFYIAYGYFPMVEVLRKDRTVNYFGVEAWMLMNNRHNRIDWVKKFNGSSEFYRAEDEDILDKEQQDIVVKIGFEKLDKKYTAIDEEEELIESIDGGKDIEDMNDVEPEVMV